MRTILVAALAAILSLATTISHAQNRDSIRLRDAPAPIQQQMQKILRERGVEPSATMMMGITTSDCPSDCNDKVAGGMCLCSPDSSGNCPGGSSKVPNEDTCRVKPDSASISGGGLGRALQVQVP